MGKIASALKKNMKLNSEKHLRTLTFSSVFQGEQLAISLKNVSKSGLKVLQWSTRGLSYLTGIITVALPVNEDFILRTVVLKLIHFDLWG